MFTTLSPEERAKAEKEIVTNRHKIAYKRPSRTEGSIKAIDVNTKDKI